MIRYFLRQQNKLFWCGKCHTLGSKVPYLRHQNNLFCCSSNMRLLLKPLFLMFDNNALIARAQRAYYALGKEMQGRCKGVASSKQALSRLMSKLRVCLEAAWSMARVWLEYGYTLLTGGRSLYEAPFFSPSRRTTSPLPTDCEFAPYGLQILRYAAILLLMMFLGMNTAWGGSSYSNCTESVQI